VAAAIETIATSKSVKFVIFIATTPSLHAQMA